MSQKQQQRAPQNRPDAAVALEAARALSGVMNTVKLDKTVRIQAAGGQQPTVEVPLLAFRLFMDILNQMAQGNPVTLVPSHHELTTQQAADMLRVSRPYLVKLIEQGEIDHHLVGNRRKVKFEDVKSYMDKLRRQSQVALDELAADAQKLKLGY